MAYDSLTTINASRGLGEIFSYINTVTYNWFSNMLVMAIWLIILITYYKSTEDLKGAFATSGFATFVVTLLFWLGGLVNPLTMATVLALAIVSIAPLLIRNSSQ